MGQMVEGGKTQEKTSKNEKCMRDRKEGISSCARYKHTFGLLQFSFGNAAPPNCLIALSIRSINSGKFGRLCKRVTLVLLL